MQPLEVKAGPLLDASSIFLVLTWSSIFLLHSEKYVWLYPILPFLYRDMQRRSSSLYSQSSPFGSRHAPWCLIPDQLAIQWKTNWPTPASFSHPFGKNSITLLFLSIKNMLVNCAPCGDTKISVMLITFTWKISITYWTISITHWVAKSYGIKIWYHLTDQFFSDLLRTGFYSSYWAT